MATDPAPLEERPWDLVSLREIALELGVARTTPSTWARRDRDFPTPVAEPPMGAVYDRAQVLAWWASHRASRRLQAADTASG
jgi:predicted DNA-binding transcriptional regulator AlpA